MSVAGEITEDDIQQLRDALMPLIGVRFPLLRLPRDILVGFEPSQIGTIVGVLMDASIPQLTKILPDDTLLADLGLVKHEGILKDREGYPDYRHSSGKRLELKLLYVDPIGVQMKKPATPREPSARLTQKVTVKNVVPSSDVLLVLAYQLQPGKAGTPEADIFYPAIADLGFFPMIECIRARDFRLTQSGGKWFGDYETPVVLSKIGWAKISRKAALDETSYGRKESEGKDYNEDTNFGKLKRIPYEPLQRYLKKHGADYIVSGDYPKPWRINKPVPCASITARNPT
jgi:hypothetical protein